MTATVSELFDSASWGEVPGFEDLQDLTYHRHGRLKAVVLMNRPEAVRQARRDLKEAA